MSTKCYKIIIHKRCNTSDTPPLRLQSNACIFHHVCHYTDIPMFPNESRVTLDARVISHNFQGQFISSEVLN